MLFPIILKSDRKALAGEAVRGGVRGEGQRDDIAQDSGVQGR